MLFFDRQTKDQQNYYLRVMSYIAALSKLFSDSDQPYYNYRVSENLFCRAFDAKNLSRSDVSADASKGNLGIGIKTFLEKNGHSFEKVAEFSNKDVIQGNFTDKDLIQRIAQLRNQRLQTTRNIFELDQLIYHCIVRNTGYMRVYETDLSDITLGKIRIQSNHGNDNNIWFEDDKNEYKFTRSKSTLYKRFHSPSDANQSRLVEVNIHDDPFALLEDLFREITTTKTKHAEQPFIILPMYSDNRQDVMPKSGLNQWNAGGRKRNDDEVYIPIPMAIHHHFPDFFPPRDQPFDLELPNGDRMNAKVCQENSKALMSNPNKKLGEWLLRDVLDLAHGELLTMEKLQAIGLDSVIIHKQDDGQYTINFKDLGSYEDFKQDYLSD